MSASSTFLRDTWRLIKPYWTSNERFGAWLLLSAVIALTLAMVYMNVLFNDWYNSFYNALQEKDKASFWKLMGSSASLRPSTLSWRSTRSI
jgi:putative ATP-binding cassette transporter